MLLTQQIGLEVGISSVVAQVLEVVANCNGRASEVTDVGETNKSRRGRSKLKSGIGSVEYSSGTSTCTVILILIV